MDRHSWCPKCRVYVHNNQVTFQETHDGCGCPVLEKDPEESCAALRDRLALAEKVVDNARELTREHFGKFYEPGGCRCNMCASIRAYNAALKEG